MRREENITQGRDALAREPRREMIIIPGDQLDDFIAALFRPRQNRALCRHRLRRRMTIANCLPKLKEEWQKLKASEEKAGEDLPKVDLSRVHATDGVVVEGFDGLYQSLPVTRARCRGDPSWALSPAALAFPSTSRAA